MGEPSNFRLYKHEILTDIKLIDKVFKSNQAIKAYPLLFGYNHLENSKFPLQVMFSVPKRKFKKAVDRNRIKRLLRECFRLKKHQFYEALGQKSIYGTFIYTHNEIADLPSLDKSMSKIIAKLHESLRD